MSRLVVALSPSLVAAAAFQTMQQMLQMPSSTLVDTPVQVTQCRILDCVSVSLAACLRPLSRSAAAGSLLLPSNYDTMAALQSPVLLSNSLSAGVPITGVNAPNFLVSAHHSTPDGCYSFHAVSFLEMPGDTAVEPLVMRVNAPRRDRFRRGAAADSAGSLDFALAVTLLNGEGHVKDRTAA